MIDQNEDHLAVQARHKAEQTQYIDDLKRTMATAFGRSVVWRILSESGFCRPTYSPGVDQLSTHFYEGRRSIGITLFADVDEHCHPEYLKAREENQRHQELLNVKPS